MHTMRQQHLVCECLFCIFYYCSQRGMDVQALKSGYKNDQADFTGWMYFLSLNHPQEISPNPDGHCTNTYSLSSRWNTKNASLQPSDNKESQHQHIQFQLQHPSCFLFLVWCFLSKFCWCLKNMTFLKRIDNTVLLTFRHA